jgi:hypothetical protein
MSSKKHSSKLVSQFVQYRVPESVTLSAVEEILQSLDCPRSLAVWIIIRDDPSQLKTLAFNPLDYNNLVDFRDAYAATKLLSKSTFLKTGIDKQQVAFTKFSESEALCRQTNFRLTHLTSDPSYRGPNVWMYNTFIRKIEDVLVGYSPEDLFNKANWGPGVTTLLKGVEASATNKFQCETGITRDLYYIISDLFSEAYPIWGEHLNQSGFPSFETGNYVVTVPKDAFTDRVIAIEPGINLWFQKAIGLMIRERLFVHGIDLNSQERNQQLARLGSYDSKLATVDFSSASDTIAFRLVEGCLPPHWFQIMDACRSHFGKFEGKLIKWEKFSSMGNGFTFELESLIFYAAAFAVCSYLKLDTSQISVFGDDVILPSSAFDLFSSFSSFLGFSVNKKKSFSSSVCFRESCGSHYYDGIDVKPIFVKNIALTLPELFRYANLIRYWAHRRNSQTSCDSTLKSSWLILFKAVPKKLRIFGCFGKGDGFIIGNFDEAVPVRAKHGIEGYYVWQFGHVGITRHSEKVGLLLNRLRNNSIQEYGNNYTLRGRTRVQLTRTLVSQWYNLGPWI